MVLPAAKPLDIWTGVPLRRKLEDVCIKFLISYPAKSMTPIWVKKPLGPHTQHVMISMVYLEKYIFLQVGKLRLTIN
jgi:hypothetical protein